MMKKLSLHWSTYFWPDFQDTHSSPFGIIGDWAENVSHEQWVLNTRRGGNFLLGWCFLEKTEWVPRMGWVDIGRLLEEKERRGWKRIALATYGQWLLSWSSQIQNIPSQRILLDRVRQTQFWLCLFQVLWIESNDFPFPSLSFLICKMGTLRVSPCGKASSLAIKKPHKIQPDHISQPLL